MRLVQFREAGNATAVAVVDGEPGPVGGVQHQAEAAEQREQDERRAYDADRPPDVRRDAGADTTKDAAAPCTGRPRLLTGAVVHASMIPARTPAHIGVRPGTWVRVPSGSGQG